MNALLSSDVLVSLTGLIYCIFIIATSFNSREITFLIILTKIWAIISGVLGLRLIFYSIVTYGMSFHETLYAIFPFFILILFSGISYQILKFKKKHYRLENKTTGKFGSARFAAKSDLSLMSHPNHSGALFGKDDNDNLLRYDLKNRTIISSPGGGKSTAIAIPALLTEDRPFFVNDVRGELWAVTARHRRTGFGRTRKVIAIDPFGVLQQAEFQKNKPRELHRTWTLNPFDFISDDVYQRQRDINTLVSSLIIREGKSNQHWDDNAEILLSGLIDYVLKTEKLSKNVKDSKNSKDSPVSLVSIYNLFLKDQKSFNALLENMLSHGGMAQAASAQLLKTDTEERGSIYSSTFRQIKWLMDENMQRTFSQSNFDLHDFVLGNMDIFIVLPEDQIIFHQRVFRMVFALVTNLLSKVPPSELPKQDILFLLDELGQLGYCKDVERAIEILRARKSVIWAFFQSLGQIKLYEKPDIFLNAKMKQIFEVDDLDTMQWLQALIGKETILTESKSHNNSQSQKKMQLTGGSVSSGQSENIHETGVDLVPINTIRELASDEQFVIIRGHKIIKCKRLFYYEEPLLDKRHDKNPYI